MTAVLNSFAVLFLALTDPVAAESSFDVGMSSLPARFQGNSVEWVLRFGTLAPKGASETTAEYAARRRAFRSEVFAFVPDKHKFRYDKSQQTIAVTVDPTSTRVDAMPGRFFTAYDVRRTKLPPHTEAGRGTAVYKPRPTAAERRAVLYTTRIVKQTQIVTDEWTFDVPSQSLAFVLKMPPDRARIAKSQLRVALICMPRLEQLPPAREAGMREATGMEREIGHSGASEDETRKYYFALRCNLLQVWLFNFATGEVYGRFTPQGAFVPRD